MASGLAGLGRSLWGAMQPRCGVLSLSVLRRGLTSVAEARQKIFGWALPRPEEKGIKLKTLKRLKKRGVIGPKVTAYFPEKLHIEKHPIIRKMNNQEREDRLELLKKLGRGAPKKGAGGKKKKK
ncbi:MAG: hypothetical protein SGPRY_007237 [Prymnesium sp.]